MNSVNITVNPGDKIDMTMLDGVTINEVHITYDLTKPTKALGEFPYSDVAFFHLVQNRMIKLNSQTIVWTTNIYRKINPEKTVCVGVKIANKNDGFHYRYIGGFHYVYMYFGIWTTFISIYKYLTNKSFRLGLQREIREAIWKFSPQSVLIG